MHTWLVKHESHLAKIVRNGRNILHHATAIAITWEELEFGGFCSLLHRLKLVCFVCENGTI